MYKHNQGTNMPQKKFLKALSNNPMYKKPLCKVYKTSAITGLYAHYLLINKPFDFLNFLKTRGPRGPWVAHLRKRSKVTVKPIIENPRGII